MVLAAGARPRIPQVAGLETVPFHTSDTIMRIDEVPGHLVIIGGGFIAAEMSHVFGTFGAEVTVIGRSSRVLSHEDWEIGTRFTRALGRQIDLRVNVTVTSVEPTAAGVVAHCSDGSVVEGDTLLVAAGRVPNGDQLAVERTGVRLDEYGYVVTDDTLATAILLALRMQRPLFLEGEPGTGKTMLAEQLAESGDTETALEGDLVNPAEDAGEDEDLPAFELDELATGGPVALDVGHQLGELADAFGGTVGLALDVGEFRVPGVSEFACFGTGEVIEVTLAGKAVPFAGDDLTGDDVTGIGRSDLAVGCRRAGQSCAHWSCVPSSNSWPWRLSLVRTRARALGERPKRSR